AQGTLMHRRHFLSASLGAPLLSAPLFAAAATEAFGGPPRDASEAGEASQAPPASSTPPLFYLWRQYTLRNDPQQQWMAASLRAAAGPALNRLGIHPIGGFEALTGAATPTLYVIAPHASVDTLLGLDAKLDADADYLRAADPYLKASALEPAYV